MEENNVNVPEVMEQVVRVVDWFGANRAVGFDVKQDLVGGVAYDAHGTPLTDDTLAAAMDADAVLFGSIGGPKYDDAPRDKRPEAGLLKLRKEMELFANLRPALTFEGLLDASSLKEDVVKGLDMLIIRELLGGLAMTLVARANSASRAVHSPRQLVRHRELLAQVSESMDLLHSLMPALEATGLVPAASMNVRPETHKGLLPQQVAELPRCRGADRPTVSKCAKHDDDEACAICLCEIAEDEEVIALPCRHSYHARCVGDWLQRSPTCPSCSLDVAKALDIELAPTAAEQRERANRHRILYFPTQEELEDEQEEFRRELDDSEDDEEALMREEEELLRAEEEELALRAEAQDDVDAMLHRAEDQMLQAERELEAAFYAHSQKFGLDFATGDEFAARLEIYAANDELINATDLAHQANASFANVADPSKIVRSPPPAAVRCCSACHTVPYCHIQAKCQSLLAQAPQPRLSDAKPDGHPSRSTLLSPGLQTPILMAIAPGRRSSAQAFRRQA